MSAPRKILLADDSVDAADTTADLLRLDGFEVRVTYDGLQAVEAARSFRPDVVILDINMPVMDGYEAAARLREESAGKHLVLIAVTGETKQEDVEQAFRAGFDHHLAKPVAGDALGVLVAACLAKQGGLV